MKPEEIRAWRKGNGYTQAALAGVLGVWPFTVSRWELGAREVPPFLHLALWAVERQGEQKPKRGAKKKKRRQR